jgi:hypothetical protein
MNSEYPEVELPREWDQGGREECVNGLGDRVWKAQDLRRAVDNEPIHQVPLAFLDLAAHSFSTEGGLIDFAIHMKHVNESDPDDPIIFDQWGRILDGRHRIVKALLEGRTVIPAKKVPDGTAPTYYKQ